MKHTIRNFLMDVMGFVFLTISVTEITLGLVGVFG